MSRRPLDLGDRPRSDVMMLYQVLKETEACGGRATVRFPHPDAPLEVTAVFVAQRPVRWRDMLVDPGQMATITLTYHLSALMPRQIAPSAEEPGGSKPGLDSDDVSEVVRAICAVGPGREAEDLLREYGNRRVEAATR